MSLNADQPTKQHLLEQGTFSGGFCLPHLFVWSYPWLCLDPKDPPGETVSAKAGFLHARCPFWCLTSVTAVKE